MRAWLVIVCALVACKDKRKPEAEPLSPTPPAGDAGTKWNVESHAPVVDAAPPPVGEWASCKAALEKAVTAPPTKRVEILLDGCHPCGEWKPLLDWQTLQEDGGPNRKVIETTMAGCKAWCNPNAKIRFMGALDDGRASKKRTPWRELAQQCGEEVSARPDTRFVSAPYFALDRIARWAAEQPDGAKALEPIVIPLPAISQTGVGVQLPETAVTKPDMLPVQITVTTAAITVGPMPIAKLAANGVLPQGEPYPGTVAKPKDVGAVARKLGDKAAIFAHPNLPASALRDAVAWSGMSAYLAVTSSIGFTGWQQHGISPVELKVYKPSREPGSIVLDETGDAAIAEVKKLGADGTKTGLQVELGDKATVGSLAKLLGAMAYFEVPHVNLVRRDKSK